MRKRKDGVEKKGRERERERERERDRGKEAPIEMAQG